MSDFNRGLRAGLPIILGYLPVSITFGMTAASGGLPPLAAVVMSATNLTSAGQFAGSELILSAASLVELIFTMLVINFRYFFMSLSLSQKLAPGFTVGQRMLFAFGVTDEVFGVASTAEGPLTFPYTAGLVLGPLLSWTGGTALGAYCSGLLPGDLSRALGITLYAMFIAILIPNCQKSKKVFAVTAAAGILGCVFYYLPPLSQLSSGWTIIIISVLVSAVAAALECRREGARP